MNIFQRIMMALFPCSYCEQGTYLGDGLNEKDSPAYFVYVKKIEDEELYITCGSDEYKAWKTAYSICYDIWKAANDCSLDAILPFELRDPDGIPANTQPENTSPA